MRSSCLEPSRSPDRMSCTRGQRKACLRDMGPCCRLQRYCLELPQVHGLGKRSFRTEKCWVASLAFAVAQLAGLGARLCLLDGGVCERHDELQNSVLSGNTPNRIPPYPQEYPQQTLACNRAHWTAKNEKAPWLGAFRWSFWTVSDCVKRIPGGAEDT